jgi:fucose permease
MLVPQGSLGVAMLILVTFFLSPIFPTIFAITIRGQGKHTHFASAALIMAEVGGAVWPSIAYGVHHGDSVNTLIVAVVLWGLSILWPTMLSLSRVMKRWVDPRWSRQRSAPDDPGIVAAAAL